MKYKVLLSIFCILLALVSIGNIGTYAYHTSSAVAGNVITAGNTRLELHQRDPDGEDFHDQKIYILPGDTVYTNVTCENVGTHPLYTRVLLINTVSDPALNADDCIELDVDPYYWTYHDGFYYYNFVLEPGETTEPLFTQIYFNGVNIDNKYLGEYFAMTVTAFAVQSEHNGENVWEAMGWPVPEGGDAQ